MSDIINSENIHANDVPVYALPELPEQGYVFMLSNSKDLCNGNVYSTFRLPLDRLTNNGLTQSHSYSLWAGTPTPLAIPFKQVVPAYITSSVPHTITKAKSDILGTLAQFLVISTDPNDATRQIIQSSGFYKFPENHTYIVGVQMYLSDTIAGGVTTVAPTTNPQKLFIAVDQTTILINI